MENQELDDMLRKMRDSLDGMGRDEVLRWQIRIILTELATSKLTGSERYGLYERMAAVAAQLEA